jgi:hypothetical protein
VNEPQLVCITTLADVDSSREPGRFSCVSSWRAPGSLTRLQPAGIAVPAVTAVDRAGDKKFPGKVDPGTGRFTVPGLPLDADYDLVIDAGGVRLEGVNLRVPRSDFEEEQPLTKEDVETLKKIALSLNKFENEVDVMVVAGNCQHAAVLLNKKRTTPFYESKPGEMIWRLELWHFERPEDDWIKSQDELGVVLYRQRLQKADFARKSLTLDPALGGLRPTAKQPEVDVGRVKLPPARPGIHLRPEKGK